MVKAGATRCAARVAVRRALSSCLPGPLFWLSDRGADDGRNRNNKSLTRPRHGQDEWVGRADDHCAEPFVAQGRQKVSMRARILRVEDARSNPGNRATPHPFVIWCAPNHLSPAA